MSNDRKLALVYSCSGASSAAQMANHIAVKLDRLKVAEMSCIAGVSGDGKPLVRTAKSGRPIIALDGCPLHCAAQILKRHGLQADKHCDLSKMGVKKNSMRTSIRRKQRRRSGGFRTTSRPPPHLKARRCRPHLDHPARPRMNRANHPVRCVTRRNSKIGDLPPKMNPGEVSHQTSL